MKQLIIFIISSLIVLLSACAMGEPQEKQYSTNEGLIHQGNMADSTNSHQDDGINENTTEFKRVEVALVRPIDGDTISVMYQGQEEKVRFLLVDTPETSHPRLGKQPFGEEAKVFTSRMVQNAKQIELEFDIGPTRDKYSRLLAYVYADGVMVQEALLKEGLARVAYIYPPNTRYVDELRTLQEDSQQKRIGIWEIEDYAQEDGFYPEELGQEATSTTNECTIKGNISSKGVKIYHVPNGTFYEKTKPEACFNNEKDAQLAGYRKSKR